MFFTTVTVLFINIVLLPITLYIGTSYLESGITVIESCDIGEELNLTSLECLEKQCTCENGVGSKGIYCQKHLTENCVSCNTGFYKKEVDNSIKCEKSICKCPNGIAITGESCDENNALSCESCDKNYVLVPTENKLDSPKECTSTIKCSCRFGEPLDSMCTAKHPQNCSSNCQNYYHLNETTSICEENKCSCKNGHPFPNCRQPGLYKVV